MRSAPPYKREYICRPGPSPVTKQRHFLCRRPLHSAPLRPDHFPARMSQRYVVKEKIGQGGLGDVYLATDTQLDRDVAVKRVRPPETGNAEALHQDLIREARTLSSLQHPNIVTIYDVGTDEQGPFVVMEFLKGETLDQVVDRGPLPAEDFREVVIQSLEGMIAAQALGLVHRDLKPGNLMVIWLASGKFQIKILDFGLAKFSVTATRQTEDQEDGIMGTIYFMAPEQFERLPLDARTDMYSLGCIFYQILTSKAPFDGQTGPEVMVSHLQHHVVHLVQARPDLPIWMADWVMWLISRDMDDRPPDARTALEYFRSQTSGIKNPTPQPVVPAGPVVRIVGRGTGPGGSATQRLPGGKATQQLQGTSAAARSSRPAARRTGRKKSNTGLWIILIILAAAGGALVWYLSQSKTAAPSSAQALQAVLDSPSPANTPENWTLLLQAIREGGADAAKAATLLKTMSGPPLGAAVAGELSTGSATGPGRLLLIQAVADHPSPEGRTQLLRIAGAESGAVRTAALEALSKAAEAADLPPLLRLLPKAASPGDRKLVLQAAAGAMNRNAGVPGTDRAKPLMEALGQADTPMKAELLRLLAVTGDPAAATALDTELATPGDRRTNALATLPVWESPQPSTAETLLTAASSSSSDQEALLDGFLLLAPRISAWNGGDLTSSLRKAAPLVSSAKNRGSFATALGSSAAPEAASYARELAAAPAWAAPAEQAAKAIAALQSNVVTPTPGENTLEAAKAVILAADQDAYYSATSRSVSNWKNPQSRLAWDLNIPQAGAVEIRVLQSSSLRTARSFRIRLAGSQTETPVRFTPSNEDFLPAEGGKFQIPRPGTWRLWLEPALMEAGQPLMNVRSIFMTLGQ
ncbi:MAG: serine/threonine protein kinase [Verrucomicrobiaceae bacterium]|nr:MAG: serine/threonine protein kinase [Verrucomicrobiaceae bacterium]